MAKKIIKEAVKKTIKKFKPNPNSTKNFGKGDPEKGTVGAQKTPKAKAKPTGVTKAKPTGVRKKAAINKVKAENLNRQSKIAAAVRTQKRNATATKKPGLNKREKGALALGAATAAGFVGTGLAKRKKPASEASKVTFGEAFKAARKKGEGTKFTWNGKSYTAVTKDDLKKKGYDGNELRQYANNKGKARRPIKRIGQGIKKVLLGKDKKFGGDKGLIDFIRGPKSKAKAKAKQGTANKKQTVKVNLRGGGMATGVSRSKVTPGQKSAIFRGRPDMPNVMPDRTRGGVLDTAELAGKRKPGMKAGGMAVKKYKAGGLAKRGLGKAYMKSKR